MSGTDVPTYVRERPGMSAFALENGAVYHTYSTYARGLDGLWGMYQWLDRTPKGRNEPGYWLRHHDKYDRDRREIASNHRSPGESRDPLLTDPRRPWSGVAGLRIRAAPRSGNPGEE